MARQIRTQAQIDQVNNDFETFFLPVGASLDLGDFTTYGTTDPVIDLSMVNMSGSSRITHHSVESLVSCSCIRGTTYCLM